MNTQAVEPLKAKRTRAKAPRVKTGCLTWVRRLKCDEEKPACSRCTRDGIKCDGFLPEAQQPRKQRDDGLGKQHLNDEGLKCIQYRQISADVSGNGIEKWLFHHVRSCTVRDLGRRPAMSNFWGNFVLPLAYHSDPVKYALIALGATHRVFLRNRHHALGAPDHTREENFAIHHYNRAIGHVKASMGDSSTSSLLVTLVCCLIFVCLENMRGNYTQSIRHLQAGSRLLSPQNVFAIMPPPTEPGPCSSNFSRLCDIADMFRRLGLDAGHFVGTNVVSLVDLAYYTLQTRATREGDAFKPFGNADEAHDQLKLLDIDQEIRLLGCVEEPYTLVSSDTGPTRVWAPPNGDVAFRALRRRFQNWARCYTLYTTHLLSGSALAQELQEAWMVSLQKRVWDGVFNNPVQLGRQEFEKIVEDVQLLAQSGAFSSRPLFAFEGSVIPPLVFVCSFCKHVDVRRRAVQLLRLMKRREGVWDSRQVADVFEAALDAEERGLAVRRPPNGPFLRLGKELMDLGVPGLEAVTGVADIELSILGAENH